MIFLLSSYRNDFEKFSEKNRLNNPKISTNKICNKAKKLVVYLKQHSLQHEIDFVQIKELD